MQSVLREAANIYHRARIAMLRGRMGWRPIGQGLKMEINPNDFMDRAFYLGTHDRWLARAIHMFVRLGHICVDIGAHKGYVTLRLAKAVGPNGRVFAFEPDFRARALLEKHCAQNDLENVTVLPYALGSEDGTCDLTLSAQLGWSSQFPNEQALPTILQEVEVPLRRFDDLVENGEVQLEPKLFSFVKIDVEGAEYHVLAGMRRTLAQSRPILWIEINRSSLAVAGFHLNDVRRILTDLGFSVYAPRRERKMFFFPHLLFEPLVEIGSEIGAVSDIVALKDPIFCGTALTLE